MIPGVKAVNRAILRVLLFILALVPWWSEGRADTLKIGALLSLSGNWSNLGRSSETILGLAELDINDYLQSHRAGFRIKTLIVDTALQPERAEAGYQMLVKERVIAVIGPQSSTEVEALKFLIPIQKVPIMSQGSTASALATPGDHIYRLVPNDRSEGEAVTQLLNRGGVKYLVPLWRDDIGNNGLHRSVATQFEAIGGKVYPGVQYSTNDQQDFHPVVEEINRQVTDALIASMNHGNQVAVYAASFDEVVALIRIASTYPNLQQVRWYAGDGVALSAALLQDPVASKFSRLVGLLSPNFGLSPYSATKSQRVSSRFAALTGYLPDAFTLAAYDGAWIAALTAYGKRAITRIPDPDVVRETADLYFGATGATQLDQNGDRVSGDYDFWGLASLPTQQMAWKVLCHYNSTMDQFSGSECWPQKAR